MYLLEWKDFLFYAVSLINIGETKIMIIVMIKNSTNTDIMVIHMVSTSVKEKLKLKYKEMNKI